jgi:starch phosphorylase
MVQEYTEKCYVPSAARFAKLAGDDLKRAAELSQWRRRVQRDWSQVRVEAVDAQGTDTMTVGSEMRVQANVNLGSLAPDDVEVQLFHGIVDNMGEIPQPVTAPMSHNGKHTGSTWVFKGTIPCLSSGHFGYAVRVLPRHPDLGSPFESGLVVWG